MLYRTSFGVPIKREAYKIGGKTINPYPLSNNGDWRSICELAETCKDVRSSFCISCGAGKFYDKNGKYYMISRRNTIAEAKLVIEEIRKINSECSSS